MRIVLCYPVETRHLEQLAAAAPGHEIVDAGQERIAAELLDADLFLGHAKVPVPWDEAVARGRLRWIQSSAAGMDHCLVPSVIASAEQTMALLFGLLRGLPTFFRAQAKREYIRRPTRDLHGATVGIIGFGGNGRRIAETLMPFRVRILATDLFPEDRPEHVEQLLPADQLDRVLEQSDVVILCVPLNEDTHHLIDVGRLERMKRSALLVNVARGPVVDEAALIDSLVKGQIAGAGLDVAEVEPLPAASPLWDLPQVIITPHVGAQSARRADVTTEFLAKNLRRFLAGQPLLNLVDKRLGFPLRRN
jgi:D-3-phosphoglycerate dehydrogenase